MYKRSKTSSYEFRIKSDDLRKKVFDFENGTEVSFLHNNAALLPVDKYPALAGKGGSMQFLGNAFSLQMLPDTAVSVSVVPVAAGDVPANVVSVVGHADTAAVATAVLGFPVPMNRASISLSPDDELFVVQVVGGRLPEGSTTLPEGVSFKFLRVSFTPADPEFVIL